MRLETLRPLPVIAGTSLVMALSACATAEPDAAPTPTHSTVAPVPAPGTERFEAEILPNGTIDGYVTTYNGMSVDEVNKMEHCGNETSKVLLTFDDTGSVEHVRAIADVLEEHDTGAIFFPMSQKFDAHMVEELRDRGFWVGNHSYSHPDINSLSNEEIANEIKDGVNADLFRPPYGALGWNSETQSTFFDGRAKRVAENLGMRVCQWTLDTIDYDGLSADEIVTRVRDRVGQGDVVLMHMQDTHNTLEALPRIIDTIRDLGLQTCDLPDKPTASDIPNSLPC